jgi:Ig-like domain CHU_C associated/Secretion system C-terminal sorting domain
MRLPFRFFDLNYKWLLVLCGLAAGTARAQQHTIASFSPVYAASGETVTITGTNFSSITGVSFGGVAATSFTVESATRITAVVGAGASGSVLVSKTGFANATRTGFTFSVLPTVTDIITDFGGFWNTNTTLNNPVFPNDNHNLLAFRYNGITRSTGVNDAALSANGVSFTAGNFKALPVTLNGLSTAPPLYIAAASRIDGNTAVGLFTHPNVKDLSVQNVLTDGANGLNLGTGYTNLPTSATSDFPVRSILPVGINDGVPDFLISQIADPSSSLFDTYRFLDAAGNVVGTPVQIDFSRVSALGTYFLDLFTVPAGVPFNATRPNGVFQTNTTRQIRFLAFQLSDFGINETNFAQIRRFQIQPSGVSDMAFAAYNVNNVNVPPSIEVNVLATSTIVCAGQPSSVTLSIIATSASGGALTYSWQESTDGGNTWNVVTDGGNYSGASTTRLQVSNAIAGYRYRAVVDEAGGFSANSTDFTITEAASTAPLGGTLNPTAITNCLNATSGATALTVSPSGGTGTYSYQWSSSNAVNGVYTDIPGAVTNSYNPPLSAVGVLYYKVRIISGCFDVLSTAAAVTISGAEITSTSGGTICATGTVPLSATASGGTISWFSVATAGTPIGTGSNFTTPSISTNTLYYASTTLSGCTSARVPVLAQVASSIALNASNFNIIFATDICAGSASDVIVSTSALSDGVYTVTYNVTGANPLAGSTATMNVAGGIGSFSTSTLAAVGANTITIARVRVGTCEVTPTSGNTRGFLVNAGAPDASNLAVSVANGCTNLNSLATVTSNTLPSGTYLVAFDVTGTNTLNSLTAQMVFTAGTPGSGTFSLPLLAGTGGSNQLTITSISRLASPECVATLSAVSPGFVSSAAATVNAGTNLNMCGSDPAFNIAGNASASQFAGLLWSTSGTGTFSNNITSEALSTTTYQPSPADISAGSVVLTLQATGQPGCSNQLSSINLAITPATVGGLVGPDQTVDRNSEANDLSLTGNTGNVLRWERSLVNTFSPATNIAVTTTTLSGTTMGPIPEKTFFRAIVKNGICPELASAFGTINIRRLLPATWAYSKLACHQGKVQLEWSTFSEQNTRHFVVQKSTEPGIWANIGSVPAAQQSQRQLYYSFTDAASTASGTKSYYRIVLNDLNGDQSFSSIMAAQCEGEAHANIQLLPNPAKAMVKLTHLKNSGTIRVLNSLGKEVIPAKIYMGSTADLNVSQLPAGTYFVIVQNGSTTASQVLIKE